MTDTVIMERVWEDDDFFEIRVTARSADARASVAAYTDEASVAKLAERLAAFPNDLEDRYDWSCGEMSGGEPAFAMIVYCLDKRGHIGIEVYMRLDDGEACRRAHSCCFLIKTEAGLLNRFGKSLAALAKRGVGAMAALGE